MSGGSYNYLYMWSYELVGRREDLIAMRDGLLATGGDSQAYRDTALLVTLQDLILGLAPRLADVWQAEEWYRSCDRSREDAIATIKAYENPSSSSGVHGRTEQ